MVTGQYGLCNPRVFDCMSVCTHSFTCARNFILSNCCQCLPNVGIVSIKAKPCRFFCNSSLLHANTCRVVDRILKSINGKSMPKHFSDSLHPCANDCRWQTGVSSTVSGRRHAKNYVVSRADFVPSFVRRHTSVRNIRLGRSHAKKTGALFLTFRLFVLSCLSGGALASRASTSDEAIARCFWKFVLTSLY